MKATKKVLAAVMVCVMLFCIMPMSIFAATNESELWIAAKKIDLTEESYWLNDGKGGITETGASASKYNVKVTPEVLATEGTDYVPVKITLKDASISKWYTYSEYTWSSERTLGCIYYLNKSSSSKAELVLEGKNSIELKALNVAGVYGISFITGNGSLDITTTPGVSSTKGIVGYWSGYGYTSVKICDNATVNVSANIGITVPDSYYSGNGLKLSGNAKVNVTATGTAINGNLTVADEAKVKVSGSTGISGDIVITGGTVEAIGTSRAVSCQDIKAEAQEDGEPNYEYPVIRVNKKAKAFGALRWSEKNPLYDYSYVKITAPSHFEYFIKETASEILQFIGTEMLGPIIIWIIQQFL
ncbi:MAG: hypothetical protein IJF40_05390 [Clostridia bacterium]|nr:hypothetical protein [Clostridia bacterium]